MEDGDEWARVGMEKEVPEEVLVEGQALAVVATALVVVAMDRVVVATDRVGKILRECLPAAQSRPGL